MSKICSAREAIDLIRDRQAVASTGVIGWATPDLLLRTLAERYEQTAEPKDLTFYFPCGTGDGMDIPGMDHVACKGLMRRVIAGSYVNPRHPVTGQRPALMRMIHADEVEAYSWPIGASMHWLREVARRSPGYLTRVGLGTYVDPRHGGGKFSSSAVEDIVELVEFRGEEYLFYPTWPLNVGLIQASCSDDLGNLSFEDDPLATSAFSVATAVKAHGGVVIAQVRKIAKRATRSPHLIKVPAALVDHVVVDPEQMMTTSVGVDLRYVTPGPQARANLPILPEGSDRIIARRVAAEIRRGEVSIFGFGASSDAVLAMAEDGILDGEAIDDYCFTTEHGSYGGVVMSGWQFSANRGPDALLDGVSQFDVIDAGVCRFAALAFAEFDAAGVVNVSRFGSANPGAGGFIDIAQNARRLVFAGSFTTAGLEIAYTDGVLRIVTEGKVRKFVTRAQQITYDVRNGVRTAGQEALIITERAVFQVRPDGLALVEIAPGIDLQHDILAHMDFLPVELHREIPLMDSALFTTR